MTLPPNANRLGRPPRTLLDNAATRELLTEPALAGKLQYDQRIDPALVNEFLVDLRQFRRALNNERERPGEYLGNDSLPYLPLPYAPRAQHRPDRLPGSENYRLMRGAVEQLDAADMTAKLAERMGTDATARNDPPSLRESISAAASLHYPEE
jgi:hypothetical protein